jgi:hypothetical protein
MRLTMKDGTQDYSSAPSMSVAVVPNHSDTVGLELVDDEDDGGVSVAFVTVVGWEITRYPWVSRNRQYTATPIFADDCTEDFALYSPSLKTAWSENGWTVSGNDVLEKAADAMVIDRKNRLKMEARLAKQKLERAKATKEK